MPQLNSKLLEAAQELKSSKVIEEQQKKLRQVRQNQRCMIEPGMSERDLEGFAQEMDAIDIPDENEPECTCSSAKNMQTKLREH